LIVEKKDT
jgi:hypothetical protein